MSDSTKTSSLPRWLWITSIAICALLIAQIVRGWLAEHRVHEHAKEIQTFFEQIVIALENYDLDFRSLPPACLVDDSGMPLSSWRFNITPYCENPRWTVHREYGFDSPQNRSWYEFQNYWFCYGSANSSTSLHTGVLAIVGPGTAFDTDKPCSLKDLDGDTILIVESGQSGVHWMECGDLDIRTLPSAINTPGRQGISGHTRFGIFVGFADGSVWLLGPDVPIDLLSRFFTSDGAKENDREELLGKYRIRLE